MCEPISLTVGASILAGGGAWATGAGTASILTASLIGASAGLAAGASIEQGEAAAAQARENERIAQWQASDALARGRVEEERYRESLARFKGSQRARLAAQGVVLDTGSALDILEDTARTGELEALTIRANAEREAFGWSARASQFDFRAQRERRLGYFRGAGSILSGGASVLRGVR